MLLNEENEVTDENRDKREIDLDLSIKQSELIETVAADINAQNSMVVDGGEAAPIPKNEEGINFEFEMSKVKKNFEQTMCSTDTKVEDGMFLDPQSVICLEFNHYSADCEYVMLEQESMDMSYSQIDDQLAKYDEKQDKFRLRKFQQKSEYFNGKKVPQDFCTFFANDDENEDNVVQYKKN